MQASISPRTMAQQQQNHPIFMDIRLGDLGAVQQRVLADAGLLEERWSTWPRMTPLMAAITSKKPATIALWIIQHRGQHNLEAAALGGWTALHRASRIGRLEVVQVLVAAGADPAALTEAGYTPLMLASSAGHTDIVAFLVQLPAVKLSIDQINQYPDTALSLASSCGRQPIVQLLLDAGANPTIPAGEHSPINLALRHNRPAIAALLRHTIAEADRVRMCEAVVGREKGLCGDLYRKVLGYMLPAWAHKGLAEA